VAPALRAEPQAKQSPVRAALARAPEPIQRVPRASAAIAARLHHGRMRVFARRHAKAARPAAGSHAFTTFAQSRCSAPRGNMPRAQQTSPQPGGFHHQRRHQLRLPPSDSSPGSELPKHAGATRNLRSVCGTKAWAEQTSVAHHRVVQYRGRLARQAAIRLTRRSPCSCRPVWNSEKNSSNCRRTRYWRSRTLQTSFMICGHDPCPDPPSPRSRESIFFNASGAIVPVQHAIKHGPDDHRAQSRHPCRAVARFVPPPAARQCRTIPPSVRAIRPMPRMSAFREPDALETLGRFQPHEHLTRTCSAQSVLRSRFYG